MIKDTQTNNHQLGALTGASKCEDYYELHFATGEVAHFYVLADGIFRFLLDPAQNFNTESTPFVDLSSFTSTAFDQSQVQATNDSLIIKAGNYRIIFGQKPAVLSIFDETVHHTRMKQARPLELAADSSREFLQQNKNEFYFGGGLQNGYFSHKGRKIEVKRDHITGKGGVPLQVPFFWSNSGYGELRNTNLAGTYDFGKENHSETMISHQDPVFDTFYLIDSTPQGILAKYYALTGKPAMLPKYAFGLGHIGNFYTTWWQPSQAKQRNASKFGDNYYTRTTDEKCVSGRASLNGEENYQFSARAMLDRYRALHFPLSWFIPNYGVEKCSFQSLDFFNDYAASQGVQPGFWHAKSDTLPMKTTLAYTNNSALIPTDAANLQDHLRHKRPFVLSDNGFMGMQKRAALIFASIGGNWENIPTQVAGLVGANLSGQPLAGIAVDGAQGGGNAQIYVRDWEWKVFTPLLFNLDDQGDFSKTPFAYNKKITDIARTYLQLRSRLTNYLYTLNAQARKGEPILRPLFIAFPDVPANYTEQFGSEFMLGDQVLVAPITNGREDEAGNTLKDNLYLPGNHTMWIDLFTGQKYAGGRVYNNLSYPLWHLPVFVRGGSIFDLGNRDYVLYPQEESKAVIYDDDNLSDFEHNHCETHITSKVDASRLTVTIEPVKGRYPDFDTQQETKLTILCDTYPDRVTVKINDQLVSIQEYGSLDAFDHVREGIFYNTNYGLAEFSRYHEQKQTALQIKLASRDITDTKIEITLTNFNYGKNALVHSITSSMLPTPKLPAVDSNKITAHSFELDWSRPNNVQIELNGILYEGITGTSFTFHELTPNTRYIIRMRYASGNKVSEWSELFGVITKHAAEDYAITDIAVASNRTSRPHHPLAYLADLKLASEWQTDDRATPDNPVELTFTFEQVEKLSRMVFVPRILDHQGDPVDVSLAVSSDGENYAAYVDHLKWKADSKNKVVGLRDVRAKAIRLTIYQSSGPIVAAREVIIYRAKN